MDIEDHSKVLVYQRRGERSAIPLSKACIPHGVYDVTHGRCVCNPGYVPTYEASFNYCRLASAISETEHFHYAAARRHGEASAHHRLHEYTGAYNDYAPGEDNPNASPLKELDVLYQKGDMVDLRSKAGYLWWHAQVLWYLHADAPRRPELEACVISPPLCCTSRCSAERRCTLTRARFELLSPALPTAHSILLFAPVLSLIYILCLLPTAHLPRTDHAPTVRLRRTRSRRAAATFADSISVARVTTRASRSTCATATHAARWYVLILSFSSVLTLLTVSVSSFTRAAKDRDGVAYKHCRPLSDYTDAAAKLALHYPSLFARQGTKGKGAHAVPIVLATDDPAVAAEAQALSGSEVADGVTFRFVTQRMDRGKYNTGQSIDALSAINHDASSMTELYRDLWAMSTCGAFVGTFTSTLAWNVYELMIARQRHFPPFIGIDHFALGDKRVMVNHEHITWKGQAAR